MDGNGAMKSGWQFWIDRGGTFTDVVAKATANSSRISSCRRIRKPIATRRFKVSATSSNRERCADTGGQIEAVKMGTTVATNALLERKATAHFGHDRRLQGPASHRIPSPPRPFRARDRPARNALRKRGRDPGTRLGRRHDRDAARSRRGPDLIAASFNEGIRAVAVVFMHGYRFPDHELKVAAGARSASRRFRPVMRPAH